MKKLYVIILFLIFFNVFSFMFAVGGPVDIFPYAYDGGNPGYNLTDGENVSDEELFRTATNKNFSFSDVLSLFFVGVNIDNPWNILLSVGTLVGAALAAWLTKSPAPLVVGFVGNLMKNIYVSNMSVFNQFPINNYLMLAVGVGMILLFIFTCAEIMSSTSGEV